ncbi:MAG: type II secretion system F family protein [bacterium]|nr:type II secretion system F family protein [bacterium]
MPIFKFKVKNSAGEVETGVKEAPDKFALYREFHTLQKEVISVDEDTGKRSFNIIISNPFSGIKMHEKIIFARNLGSMLEAGLSLSRALNVIVRQSKNKKLVKVLNVVIDDVAKGKTLSDSLKTYPKIFSSLFTSMVHAGEESGSLAESLKIVALQMDRNYTLQRKVKGAMIYPAVIMVVMFAIAILMLVYIVPTLTSTFGEMKVELPVSTRIVIGISDFIRNHYFLAFGSLFGFIFAIYYYAKTATGKKLFDYTYLKLPVVGEIIKEVNSARTARTVASLLTAGVDVIESLKITEEVLQNKYYKDILNSAILEVQKGETISKVFLENTNFYPVFVGEMMSVGEETGKIGEMLRGVAEFYEDEVEQKTKDMSSIIEPVLLVVIGAAVGFFAISMISPMYSLVNVI